MNSAPVLVWLLYLVAAVQFGIAGLNLFLVPLLKWQAEVSRLPLLLREVFQVHAWFISIMVAIFAVLTSRFASVLAHGGNPIGQWLAAAIGIFWATRTVLQITYYSPGHWRGHHGRTLIHVALVCVYGGFAFVYLWVASGAAAGALTQ